MRIDERERSRYKQSTYFHLTQFDDPKLPQRCLIATMLSFINFGERPLASMGTRYSWKKRMKTLPSILEQQIRIVVISEI